MWFYYKRILKILWKNQCAILEINLKKEQLYSKLEEKKKL